MIVRPVAAADRAPWETLWKGYQTFYQVSLAAEVTETTWARFFDPAEPVHCLVAETEQKLAGMAHYLFHRTTWMINPVCYLQDIFTSPAARGRGVARKLIQAVYQDAEAAGLSRVYWMTHETNAQAMLLYDKVAKKSGFIQYRKDFAGLR